MSNFRLDRWIFGIITIIFGFVLGLETISYSGMTEKGAFIISAIIGSVFFIFLEFLQGQKNSHKRRNYFVSVILGSLCGLFGVFFDFLYYSFATMW